MAGRRPPRLGDPDRDDLEEAPNYLGTILEAFVPRTLAHRAPSVSVETDRSRLVLGESVRIEVTVRNRLPVPVEVVSATQRLWAWSVDGHVSAREAPMHLPGNPRAFSLNAGERRRFVRTWDGRIEREGELRRWQPVDPGRHTIRAFVDLTDGRVMDEAVVEVVGSR